ncbi:MAG: DPP IV N-terminal domain-containing protein [Cyanobacteria bacterium J06626_18]
MAQFTTVPSDSAVGAVYQIDLDGTDLAMLASALTLGDHSYWSPDGWHLATIIQQDGSQQLHFVSINGTESRQVSSEFPGVHAGLAWSPDGQKLVIKARQDDSARQDMPQQLHVVSVDGPQSQQVLAEFSGTYGGPAWSPDGQKLATAIRQGDSSDLYVLDLPSGEATNLTQDEETNDLTVPAWSPDGQRIAYTCGGGGVGLCIIDSDGQSRQAIPSGTFPSSLRWSPDGQKIAYGNTLSNDSYVTVVDADGSNGIGFEGSSPVWAPDSQRLAFSSLEGLVIINADGTDRRVIGAHGGRQLWLPNDTQLVFQSGNEIWRINADGMALTQVTDFSTEQEIKSFAWLVEGQQLVLAVSQSSN